MSFLKEETTKHGLKVQCLKIEGAAFKKFVNPSFCFRSEVPTLLTFSSDLPRFVSRSLYSTCLFWTKYRQGAILITPLHQAAIFKMFLAICIYYFFRFALIFNHLPFAMSLQWHCLHSHLGVIVFTPHPYKSKILFCSGFFLYLQQRFIVSSWRSSLLAHKFASIYFMVLIANIYQLLFIALLN